VRLKSGESSLPKAYAFRIIFSGHFRCPELGTGVELTCSRDSSFLPPSPPVSPTNAALCVQNDVVVQKDTLYMVFSCLTPVRFHRYSSFDPCLALSSQRQAFGERTVEESNWLTWIQRQIPGLRIPIRGRIGTLGMTKFGWGG
jgi:hypothetical protein